MVRRICGTGKFEPGVEEQRNDRRERGTAKMMNCTGMCEIICKRFACKRLLK